LKSVLMMAALAIALTGCGKSPEPPKPAAATPAAVPAPVAQTSSGGPALAAGAACKTSPTPTLVPTPGITEADLGVPFYPGAKLVKGTVGTGPDGSAAGADQETADPPDKVLAFYRELLKAQAAGRELADGGRPDNYGNTLLELSAEVGKPGIQIITTGDSRGTYVSIATNCIVK